VLRQRERGERERERKEDYGREKGGKKELSDRKGEGDRGWE
jgi:hypothetical protein